MEQLQYTIGDHERTILKFRETVRTMQVTVIFHRRMSKDSLCFFIAPK